MVRLEFHDPSGAIGATAPHARRLCSRCSRRCSTTSRASRSYRSTRSRKLPVLSTSGTQAAAVRFRGVSGQRAVGPASARPD
jgi:hypothetical protein